MDTFVIVILLLVLFYAIGSVCRPQTDTGGMTMVKMTASLEHWLWENHRDKFALISLGHIEELTEDMWENYIEWCKTDEGKEYLEGGKYYHEPI